MGECFFWYQPTQVVPDKRLLNGCVYVCVCVRACVVITFLMLTIYISEFLCMSECEFLIHRLCTIFMLIYLSGLAVRSITAVLGALCLTVSVAVFDVTANSNFTALWIDSGYS